MNVFRLKVSPKISGRISQPASLAVVVNPIPLSYLYTGKEPVYIGGFLGRRQAAMTDRGLSMSVVERPMVELSGQAFAGAQIRENGSR